MTDLTIPSFDGKSFSAYAARPERASSAPAIIVIQEIFGVNSGMRRICDDFAADGYLAICPDLFWRMEPKLQLDDGVEAERAKAFKLFEAFDVERGVDDLLAALAFARKMPGTTGKVGTIGFCLGGKLAFMMMVRSDVDCGVSYYGVGIEAMLDDIADIRHPLLMHIAGKDQFVPSEAQARITAAAGKSPYITAHTYPGVDHAFARPGGAHHDAAAAKLANGRSAAFLEACLKK